MMRADKSGPATSKHAVQPGIRLKQVGQQRRLTTGLTPSDMPRRCHHQPVKPIETISKCFGGFSSFFVFFFEGVGSGGGGGK